MHDPSTVAFEIRYPWRAYRNPRNKFERGYRRSFITIWHEDPMDFAGKCGGRSDDSCGWFTPLMRADEPEIWRKRSDYEYTCIFNKQHVTAKGEDYARVCYHPETTYDAVYWIWRAIRHEHLKGKFGYRTLWRYSSRPSASELEYIQNLASNPVDNLQFTFGQIKDAETFWPFYRCVLNGYRRHARPWYRHPRWHFWHWRFQIHPWQTFRRWALTRCAGCGKRFSWGYCPTSHSWDSDRPKFLRGEKGLYHTECSSMTMKLHKEPTAGNA